MALAGHGLDGYSYSRRKHRKNPAGFCLQAIIIGCMARLPVLSAARAGHSSIAETWGDAVNRVARWLIVDDEPDACRSLHRLIGLDEPVVIAHSAEQARAALLDEAAWIGLIVDLRLGDTSDGLDVLTLARERNPAVPATLLTAAPPDRELVNRSYAVGARLLCKPAPPPDLMGFLARCVAHAHLLGPALEEVIEQLVRQHDLTRREIELVVRVVAGMTPDEAQRDMGISPGTRKTHTNRMLAKLDALNLTEVALRVMRAALQR